MFNYDKHGFPTVHKGYAAAFMFFGALLALAFGFIISDDSFFNMGWQYISKAILCVSLQGAALGYMAYSFLGIKALLTKE